MTHLPARQHSTPRRHSPHPRAPLMRPKLLQKLLDEGQPTVGAHTLVLRPGMVEISNPWDAGPGQRFGYCNPSQVGSENSCATNPAFTFLAPPDTVLRLSVSLPIRLGATRSRIRTRRTWPPICELYLWSPSCHPRWLRWRPSRIALGDHCRSAQGLSGPLPCRLRRR